MRHIQFFPLEFGLTFGGKIVARPCLLAFSIASRNASPKDFEDCRRYSIISF